MHSHGLHTIEDKHGRWWRSVTFHRWWYGDTPETAEREVAPWMIKVGGQWHVDSARYMREHPQVIRVKLSLTGEETVDTALALGPACLYLHLVAERAGRPVRVPLPVRVTVDLTLKGVTWCLGHDDHSWHSDSPWRERLRTNHLTWWKVGRYRRECTDVEQLETHVELPEDRYPVTLTLQREVWQVRVGPYWPTRTRRTPRVEFYIPGTRRVGWSVNIEAPTGLPVPGKGENSWDCGPDAIYGTGVTLDRGPFDSADREWVAAALARAVAAVYRTRARYGSGVTDTGQ